jgi:hypothetical protein
MFVNTCRVVASVDSYGVDSWLGVSEHDSELGVSGGCFIYFGKEVVTKMILTTQHICRVLFLYAFGIVVRCRIELDQKH